MPRWGARVVAILEGTGDVTGWTLVRCETRGALRRPGGWPRGSRRALASQVATSSREIGFEVAGLRIGGCVDMAACGGFVGGSGREQTIRGETADDLGIGHTRVIVGLGKCRTNRQVRQWRRSDGAAVSARAATARANRGHLGIPDPKSTNRDHRKVVSPRLTRWQTSRTALRMRSSWFRGGHGSSRRSCHWAPIEPQDAL